MVAVLGNEALAVAVDEKVDGARGYDADEVGAEALEKGAPAFVVLDGGEDLQRLGEVEERGAQRVHFDVGVGEGGARGAELGLVEVGLQARFKYVEGGSEGRGCHASDTERSEEGLARVFGPSDSRS